MIRAQKAGIMHGMNYARKIGVNHGQTVQLK
jgi:hypothetical protein